MARRAHTGIFKTVKGERVELTSQQLRETIMRVNKWDKATYKKQYDILRNKLRSYEAYQEATGQKVGKQSVQNLLYFEARRKQREGADYNPSLEMKRIKSFTSVSSGKALQKALQGKKYKKRRSTTYTIKTAKQFRGLLRTNEKAREIFTKIKDPVKREKALADYANKIHEKIAQTEKEIASEAIPVASQGQTFGSDGSIDFDYSAYLD